jgi:Tfp pilus assembly major pilin PilA
MKQYTGMRKGISLVEMIIAIILFAALATIGLKYTKNYLNTDLQAMKARVAAATDQAAQLTQAYTIYKTETGMEPTSLNDLNSTTNPIMTHIPGIITEMSTTGWELNTSTGTGGTNIGLQFHIDLNGTTTGTTADEQYCALWNREFNSSTELNVTAGQDFGTVGDINASRTALVGTAQAFCYSRTAGDKWIMVILP